MRPSLRRLGALTILWWVGASCSDAVLPLVTTWEADVRPLTREQVQGSVGVVSQPGRAHTSIQLTRGAPGARYGWRIETGSCPAGGEVVGGRAQYPELTPGPDGSADGETVLSRELDPDGSYAALIYRLGEGTAEQPAACGDLHRTR